MAHSVSLLSFVPNQVSMRKPQEFGYIVEPDLFHDFFGHVPLLCDTEPDFAPLYLQLNSDAASS